MAVCCSSDRPCCTCGRPLGGATAKSDLRPLSAPRVGFHSGASRRYPACPRHVRRPPGMAQTMATCSKSCSAPASFYIIISIAANSCQNPQPVWGRSKAGYRAEVGLFAVSGKKKPPVSPTSGLSFAVNRTLSARACSRSGGGVNQAPAMTDREKPPGCGFELVIRDSV